MQAFLALVLGIIILTGVAELWMVYALALGLGITTAAEAPADETPAEAPADADQA